MMSIATSSFELQPIFPPKQSIFPLLFSCLVFSSLTRICVPAAHALDPALLSAGKHTLGLIIGQGFCAEDNEGKSGSNNRTAILRLATAQRQLKSEGIPENQNQGQLLVLCCNPLCMVPVGMLMGYEEEGDARSGSGSGRYTAPIYDPYT